MARRIRIGFDSERFQTRRMISNQTTQEVRTRASIVEVVFRLRHAQEGRPEPLGTLPFPFRENPHPLRSTRKKGVFYCFGCQAGGDVFKFLMLCDGLTFPESIERLAERYGILIEVSESGVSRAWRPVPVERAGGGEWFHALLLESPPRALGHGPT